VGTTDAISDSTGFTRLLGIDIGGSGIKADEVDLLTGQPAGGRHRVGTPDPATPASTRDAFAELYEAMAWCGPLGCTFPGVIRGSSTVETAANLDSQWIGVDASKLFSDVTNDQVIMVNDADAAAVAEARFGAARNVDGVVLVITLGTGLGSGLVHNGVLVPNTELGHVEIDGEDAELTASARAKDEEGLSFEEWAGRLSRYLVHLENLLSPDLIVLGGGISREFDRFGALLHTRTRITPALLRNDAGIVGAAHIASVALKR